MKTSGTRVLSPLRGATNVTIREWGEGRNGKYRNAMSLLCEEEERVGPEVGMGIH